MLFGAHCSGGIKKALDNGVAMGAEAVQLFVQSPRTWRFPNHDPDDLSRFRDRRAEAGVAAAVHALYLVNLATPDDAMYEKSVETMRATVDAACALQAHAPIFPPGSPLRAGLDAGPPPGAPPPSPALGRRSGTTRRPMGNTARAAGTI